MKEMQKNKIRVGTMTFHMAHNYGAMLQAYALEKAINQMQFPCEVIDYRLPHIDEYNCIWTRKDYIRRNGILLGTLKYVKRTLKGSYKKISVLHRKFDSFMRNSLKLSTQAYFSTNQLSTAKYDVIIFGSDQIWNFDLTGGLALEYVGKYFTDQTKLVAYAASSGTGSIKQEYKNKVMPLLQRFDSIGVREKSLAKFLEEDYGLKAETVVDPVFLLERKNWDELVDDIEIPVKEPYVLIYAFQEGEEIYRLARRIAEERNLKLVTISYRKKDGLEDMIQLTECGPKEFVALIKRASFVCTTSFHGTAFSALYERNFYCIGHPLYSQRNKDLLDLVQMNDRMVESDEKVQEITDCDYTCARGLLEQGRKAALSFLKSAITGEKTSRENEKELPELYVKRENCCGCSACYASCPVNAITMETDSEGFLYPTVNKDKCIRCYKCLSVCGFKEAQIEKGFLKE